MDDTSILVLIPQALFLILSSYLVLLKIRAYRRDHDQDPDK